MVVEIVFIILGFICCVIGIFGSILPVLPGPPVSWLGLLMLYLIPSIAIDYWFLGITLAIAGIIFALDYIIPILGTRYFGGSKSGAIGSTIGLIFGVFFPPFGFLIGPFLGAFIGEVLWNKNSNSKHALKSAIGSFIGFLASTFMKTMVAIVYLGLFFYKIFEYWSILW